MPIYEYACRDCEQEFETLVRAGQTPECPSCRGTDLRRRPCQRERNRGWEGATVAAGV